MARSKKAPVYNLKVVLQLTGIKPDTLRAWERRYGLPLPQRTSGGHRLYSQYDIEMIKWLMERQEEGMRINHAIDLWREIESDGNDPLEEKHPVGSSEVVSSRPADDTSLITGASLAEMRERWVEACLAFNEATAEGILSQSFALYPVELVCVEVLQRGIVSIGERWFTGSATVQQEHFASGLALRRLDALIAASPSPTRSEKILVGCPAQEEHVMAALMTTLFLRRYGWEVIYLGANVPLLDLEQAVASTSARLVILIASQLHTAANLFEVALQLKDAGVHFAFAGSIFARSGGLSQRIPGYYLGDRLDRVVHAVETVIQMPDLSVGTNIVRPDYQQAREQIAEKQSIIKADIWNQLSNDGIKDHTLQIANDAFMQDILAALTLGDLDSLTNEIEWVDTLVSYQALSDKLLPKYLRIFADTLDRHIGSLGQVVIDWLRATAKQMDRR